LNAISQSGLGKASKPKIIRIIARLNVGGAAQQVCTLHEKLAGYFDTRLIVGSLAEGEEDMGYLVSTAHHVFKVPAMSREVSLWADLAAFWTIFKLLRNERPQIVHTHTGKAGALGRLAAWMARVPVIVHTYHGHVFYGYFGDLKTKLIVKIERLLGKLSSQIVAISESQVQELCWQYRVVPQDKISLIKEGACLAHSSKPSRTEARKGLGLNCEDFVVAWAGRMVPVKDMALLAAVIRGAFAKQKEIFFLVVGDGTERASFESQLRGCTNVRLLGWRKDIQHIWAASDVALLTSRNEGVPTSLIEAMLAGLPFVATRVGGVPDLAVAPLSELANGMGHAATNGFLVSRTPEALLHCLEKLASDPQSAKRMGAEGQAFALHQFSVDRTIEETKLLYQALLAKKRIWLTAKV
jgi:glycosyltransferase involved in cell wall biosynthesis